jgi:hypothetical protein
MPSSGHRKFLETYDLKYIVPCDHKLIMTQVPPKTVRVDDVQVESFTKVSRLS